MQHDGSSGTLCLPGQARGQILICQGHKPEKEEKQPPEVNRVSASAKFDHIPTIHQNKNNMCIIATLRNMCWRHVQEEDPGPDPFQACSRAVF